MFIWWNLGDHDPVVDAVDSEIEIHTPLSSTKGTPYRGHDGLRQWISDIDEQFDEWYSRPDDWTDLGEGRVLVLGDLHCVDAKRYRARPNGLAARLGWTADSLRGLAGTTSRLGKRRAAES